MTDRMEHLDEGTIHAWLDGALSPDEAARVESHANSCTDCGALVAEARGLVAASSRILASLDAVPAGVIPGSDSGTDQLAALRARRQAATRVWWRDRRFVAAASLLLVAGVSSVVWRSTPNQSPVAADAVSALDSATVPVSAPTPAPAVASTEASPAREAAPTRAVVRRADSVANAKAAAAGPVPGAVAEMTAESRVAGGAGQQRDVANTARLRQDAVGAAAASTQQQATDSTKAVARGDTSAFARKVQQQVQTPPTPPRIIPEQQQQGAARPASPTPLAARARSEVDAASGLRLALPAAVGCYSLTLLTPGEATRTVALTDTIQLLNEAIPERSDPSWLRARTVGGSDSSAGLAWRMVDSVTVELRPYSTTPGERLRAFLVRFRALPSGAQPPDVSGVTATGLAGVRAALAVRVDCR